MDGQKESDVYEPTVQKQRCAKKLSSLIKNKNIAFYPNKITNNTIPHHLHNYEHLYNQ